MEPGERESGTCASLISRRPLLERSALAASLNGFCSPARNNGLRLIADAEVMVLIASIEGTSPTVIVTPFGATNRVLPSALSVVGEHPHSAGAFRLLIRKMPMWNGSNRGFATAAH